MKSAVLVLVPVLAFAGVGVAAAPALADPHVLVVAPGGSDSGSGSTAQPMRTVAAAIQRLRDGGSIELRGGTYHQRILLDHDESVTVEPYRHERVVLSGAGIAPPDGRSAMVTIVDSRSITVRDLEITGYTTRRTAAVPIGVYVHGHDDGVRILGLHVHDEGNDNGTLGSFDINAHGIAAYGDDPHQPISRLEIRGNTLDHLRLGASETVVVNGNVDHWAITGNRIHDDDNIGIDAIGFEPTISGAARYSEVNRARDGVISGNTVSRIRSQGNPAYWEDGSWCDCADGIYVDGGTRIRITGNRTDRDDIGIEVAAENPRGNASHVTVDHNLVTGSLFTGITTGGYCDGGNDCGGVRTGSSYDNVFAYNTLRGNNRLDDGSPELLVQYSAHDDRFVHNDITATNAARVVYGTVARADDGAGDVSDFNTFRASGGAGAAQFGWRGVTYSGFAAYRAATHQDRHSVLR
jgi:hypothetical protein